MSRDMKARPYAWMSDEDLRKLLHSTHRLAREYNRADALLRREHKHRRRAKAVRA